MQVLTNIGSTPTAVYWLLGLSACLQTDNNTGAVHGIALLLMPLFIQSMDSDKPCVFNQLIAVEGR